MSKIAVVTDSSCCLPPDLIERHGICVVRHAFTFDGDLFYDGDLPAADFYDRLRTYRRYPTTTSPSPGQFLDAYRQAAQSGTKEVLCLPLPASYSATYGAALEAAGLVRQEIPHLTVQVTDSHALAMSHGFAVLAAARAAETGARLEKAAAIAESVGCRSHLVGVLETTRYLARGGRVPWVVHWATALLRVKPILSAYGGEVSGVARARTYSRAFDYLMNYLRKNAAEDLQVAVMHADAPERAESLADRVKREMEPATLIVTELTSVMGVHTGPGFVGLAFYSGPDAPGAEAGEGEEDAVRST